MPTYKFQVGDLVRIRADVTEEELWHYSLSRYAPRQGIIEFVRDYDDLTEETGWGYLKPTPYVINGWVYPEHILEHACLNWQLHRELRRVAAGSATTITEEVY
jgi:hypothetical protein